MRKTNSIVGGLMVMLTFSVLGQGCCGRRHHPRDAASVSHPAPAPAPTTTTTTN